MAYGNYKETGMIACALNAQCVESNQLMADAHRLGHEAQQQHGRGFDC